MGRSIISLTVCLVFFLASCKKSENLSPQLNIVDGFEVEKILESSDSTFGSWVSITSDNKGRLLVADQYGKIFRFYPPSDDESINMDNIESIDLEIGYAQGLLWTEDGLFVTVNQERSEKNPGSGLYKLIDSNSDDNYDKMILIQSLKGGGEHGPHSLLKGPDGYIYLIAGNGTLLPDSIGYQMPDIYENDNILPIITDPHGIFSGWKPPGGWIVRMDKNGENWELWAGGFRNSYDIAFDENGELFTFDSDMEWDLGTPWYRPVRFCHVIKGAEFGWRTGSGKWPPYYPDNLPGILDIGQGSPTGLLEASKLNFPPPYNSGIFAMDWSYGTMYHVTMAPSGASFTATATQFLSGKGLPLTDLVALNGDMYFITGGRRLESGLYRVRAKDKIESISKKSIESKVSVKLLKRRYLENTKNIDSLWKYLGDEDRFIRFAARTSLELLEDESWVERISTEDDPEIRIQSFIAICRLGSAVDMYALDSWIQSIPVNNLKEYQKLEWLRAVQLFLLRFEGLDLDREVWLNLIKSIDEGENIDIIREKLKLLAYLQDEESIEWGLSLLSLQHAGTDNLLPEEITQRSEQYGGIISLMRRNNPQTRRIGILEALSVIKSGWNKELREKYFLAFNDVFVSGGGMSYKGFVKEILNRALLNVTDSLERQQYKEMSGVYISMVSLEELSNIPTPKGPGKNWSINDISKLVEKVDAADAKNGENMYKSALCFQCHIKGDIGNPYGPDLTTVSSRFTSEEILKAIISPSSSISDQYDQEVFELKNGRTIIGRLHIDKNDTVVVLTNPFNADHKEVILKGNIEKRYKSDVSSMPSGLLNRLNEKEIRDLLKFLM